MYAQDSNRPAPVLIVLLFLGIVVLLIFNPPAELQPSADGTPLVPVTNITKTPAAPTPVPTQSAVEQTEVVVQTEIGIVSGRATLETIDREAVAARRDELKQVWAATAEVRSTNAVIQDAEEKTISTKIANLKGAVSANATQAVIDQTTAEENNRRDREEGIIKFAAIIAIGAAASVTLITAGVAIHTILSEHRQKELAKAARLEQERLVIEAQTQQIEARKTLLAIEQAQKIYANNGHKPVKQIAA